MRAFSLTTVLWLWTSVGISGFLGVSFLAKRWFVIPRTAFRIGFGCGLSMCVAWVFTGLVVGLGLAKRYGLYVLPILTLEFEIGIISMGEPLGWFFFFLLPIETGLAGFASFSSRWRYPPLLLSLLGLVVAGGFLFLALRIPR